MPPSGGKSLRGGIAVHADDAENRRCSHQGKIRPVKHHPSRLSLPPSEATTVAVPDRAMTHERSAGCNSSLGNSCCRHAVITTTRNAVGEAAGHTPSPWAETKSTGRCCSRCASHRTLPIAGQFERCPPEIRLVEKAARSVSTTMCSSLLAVQSSFLSCSRR